MYYTAIYYMSLIQEVVWIDYNLRCWVSFSLFLYIECTFIVYFMPTYYFAGVVVYDYELKIGWGKAVSLPAQALPAPPPGHMAIRSKEVFFSILLPFFPYLIVKRCSITKTSYYLLILSIFFVILPPKSLF